MCNRIQVTEFCEKELLASTWGLVALAPWLQRTVVSWTDNTVAMRNGRDALDGAALGGCVPTRRRAVAARRAAQPVELRRWAELLQRIDMPRSEQRSSQ